MTHSGRTSERQNVTLWTDERDLEDATTMIAMPSGVQAEDTGAAVLVVDDTDANLLAMEAVLAPLGVTVDCVRSGTEALGRLLASEYTVVLLDVMMPELDGFETAKLIRSRQKNASTPIIFVTANSPTPEDLKSGYLVGAADYITKPFDPDVLRAKVRVFLELQRARDERQRSVAYRSIAETIPQQVWTAKTDGLLDYVSSTTAEYFGRPVPEILGDGWSEHVHPDDLARCHDRWSQALATGEQYEIEFRLRRHDGDYRWHLGRALADRDSRGRIRQWFGTNTDIQERKEIETELRRAIQTRDDVLATVSHDLRGPLGAVLLAAEMIDPTDAGATMRSRHVITRSVQRMEQLIRDLLDISSIESGHLSIEPQALAVEDVVQEAVESVRTVASAKVVDVITDLGSPTVHIQADRGRVLQVFSNILGNAVKFTPSPGRISIRESRTSDRYVTFAISDTGPGIRSDELPHVFERFWQAKETAKAGTGLGLAISKGIVQRHGGAIWVESELGAGTTFFFTLPVAR